MAKTSNKIELHRVMKAPAERLYRAFLNSDAFAQWLPPFGFTCKVHSRNATVGGTYEISFTNLTTQKSHSWKGEFLELIENTLIKYSDQFSDPNFPEKMMVTVSLKNVFCGTELKVVQENTPEAIPLEMCYLGWQESLAKLTQLVEPEIKD